MPARPAKTDARPRIAGQPPIAPAPGVRPAIAMASPRTPASPTPRHFPTLDAASRGFADLGVPATWSPRSARMASANRSRSRPRSIRAGGPGCAGPWPYGLGQDSGLRPANDQQTRRVVRPAALQPRGLVLVPTRELAMQVADVLVPLARTAGLSLVLVAGGMPYPLQIRRSPVVSTSWSRRPDG